jgi:hypothetical protein
MKKKTLYERALRAALLFEEDDDWAAKLSGPSFAEAIARSLAAYCQDGECAVFYRTGEGKEWCGVKATGSVEAQALLDGGITEALEGGKEGGVTVHERAPGRGGMGKRFLAAILAARKGARIMVLRGKDDGRFSDDETQSFKLLCSLYQASLKKGRAWNKRLKARSEDTRRESLLHAQSVIRRGSAACESFGSAIDYSASTGSDFCKAYLGSESSFLFCAGDVTAAPAERHLGLIYLDTWLSLVARSSVDAKGVIRRLNSDMTRRAVECYASVCVIRYRPDTNTLEVSGAGSIAVVVFCHETMTARTIEFGTACGIQGDAEITGLEIRVAPGDIVLACTDGVFQARRSDGQLYGVERVREFVRTHYFLSAAELAERVLADVRECEDRHVNGDDRTVMAVKT